MPVRPIIALGRPLRLRVAKAVQEHGALLDVELNHTGGVVPSAVSSTVPGGLSPVERVEILAARAR